MRKALMILTLIILVSCHARGLIQPLPDVRDPENAVEITIKRTRTICGAAGSITFTIDGQEIYGLGLGEKVTFQMEPGDYLFGAKGGMQKTEITVSLKSGQRYFYCMRFTCIPMGDLRIEPRTSLDK